MSGAILKAKPMSNASKISTAWFNDLLAKWLPGECGPKPTHDQLAVPLALGKRPGVEALHIAMCLRPGGCTVRQFQIAGSCGPANNYRRRLVHDGLLTVHVTGKPYAFVAALTAKGKQAVAQGEKAAVQAAANAGKPGNGKAKMKAEKVGATARKMMADAKARAGDPGYKGPTKGSKKHTAANKAKPASVPAKPGMVTVSHGDPAIKNITSTDHKTVPVTAQQAPAPLPAKPTDQPKPQQ